LALAACGAEAPSERGIEETEVSELDLERLRQEGNRLLTAQWTTTTSGQGTLAPPKTAFDSEGNLFAAFSYFGQITIGSLPLPGERDEERVGLVKFDRAGRVVWSRAFGPVTGGSPQVTALTADASGNVFLGGQTTAPLPIDRVTLQPGSFLAKFAPNGTPLLARNTRPEPSTSFGFADLAVARNGDLVALANFLGATGLQQVMVIRYRGGDLTPQWTYLAEQANAGENVSRGLDVSVNAFDQVYVAGFIRGTVRFGGTPYTAEPGQSAPFVAAFRPDGSAWWARRLGATGVATSVSSRDGHLVVSGYGTFSGRADAAYVTSLDLSGRSRWVRKVSDVANGVEARLGPDRSVVVLSNAPSAPPGVMVTPLYLCVFDRVRGDLLSARKFNDVIAQTETSNIIDPGLELSETTGVVNVSGLYETVLGETTVDFGTGPVRLVDDAFFVGFHP
ncbi:MAG TPA: hypothetical protein VEY30_05515, partial [Myxococcaceae bacterium]|nr:hypothetical protein [Myxococcaceae bacterium]